MNLTERLNSVNAKKVTNCKSAMAVAPATARACPDTFDDQEPHVKNRLATSVSCRNSDAVLLRDSPRQVGDSGTASTKTVIDPLRRNLLRTLLSGAVVGSLAVSLRARAAAPLIEVWTIPSCPCCHGWFEHLEQNGFETRVHDGGHNEARARLGMPDKYSSCHTGAVGGYAIEGHVPAREIHRLLKDRPDAIGLALPTMPIGSPGMDGPAYSGLSEPYDVLLIKRDGSTSIYASYE
jgi:hypothetical protein